MIRSKLVGLLIMVSGLCALIAYVIGIIYATTFVLQLIVTLFVFAILGVLTWIGYTMFTEPPPPKVSGASELDDLQPETISTVSEHPRFSVIIDAEIGEGTIVRDHVNLYKCKIGRNCKIEPFVYIEENVVIGDNCKIKPQVNIPTGVVIEDDVFIGPGVCFTNDKYPRVKGEWQILRTIVGHGASIGANAVILPGVRIGKGAMIGAGSIVTKDVPDGALVCGNPAKIMKK